MKKCFFLALAVAGLGVFAPAADARDHERGRGRDHYRSRHVYIIEHGRPVYRRAYFDDYDRCYTDYGPRRVYVESYYNEYPRHYRRARYYNPGVSFSFGFRG